MTAFSRRSLDAGGWGRAGRTELELGLPVAVSLGGRTLNLPASGKIKADLELRGEIDTWEIGRVDHTWPPPEVHIAGRTVPRPGAWPLRCAGTNSCP